MAGAITHDRRPLIHLLNACGVSGRDQQRNATDLLLGVRPFDHLCLLTVALAISVLRGPLWVGRNGRNGTLETGTLNGLDYA
jgi:hypothetical protein